MLGHGKLFLWSSVVVLLPHATPHRPIRLPLLSSLNPLLPSVAICYTLAICPVPNACPLPFTLCPLPHVTGLGWSCSVLPSFCPRHLVWFCGMVSACVAGLLCYLLPFAALWQLALCPMHAICPPLCALCVFMWGVTSAFPQLELFPLLMS